LKALLKGFQWPFRSSKSVKYSWCYGPNKVCDRQDIEDIRRQKRKEGTFRKEKLPGRFMVRKLFG